jgi:hypothetical protein
MLMFRRRILTAFLIGLGMSGAVVAADARAGDVDPRFGARITSKIQDKPMRLVLTGTAMRTKYLLNVYAIGSYVQEGVKVRDADTLAKINVVKQLHLIFERDVDGKTMAESFRESIGMNHPAPAFAAELAKLEQYFRAHNCKSGDHIELTYIPGLGLGCQLVGKPGVIVENVAFAQAAWDLYVGRKNLSLAIRSGLTSRLR